MDLHVRACKPLASDRGSITTLPVELLRLIVGHLVPAWNIYRVEERANRQFARLGSKENLKNANLSHSCFRQWVPEFLFQDMILNILLPGMSSQLERLLIDPLGAKVSKYIRSVQVQVPPAMQADFRYERGVFTLEDNTKIKLCNQLGVKKVEDLTVEQKDFCEQYHAYMVQPFPDDPRWSSLASFAYSSCKTVLPVLPKLEHVGCGICLPEDFPTPTSTNSFVKRWRNSVAAVNPVYIYDFDVNLAWISGIALHSVPLHVKSLGMSAANLATLSSMVTVNRILSTICNIHKLSQNPVHRVGTMAVTELSLTIGGIRGTHGIDTWAGNTGSIGMVKYWADAINLLPNLTYLALVGDRMELPGAEQMSNDLDHGWMTWLFRSLVSLRHLESFSLYYFTITPETIPQVFQSMSESLRHVSFRDVSIDLEDSKHNHAKLGSWSEQVAWLTKRFQSARVIMKGYHIGEFYTNDKTDSKDYPESRAALAKLGVEFEE